MTKTTVTFFALAYAAAFAYFGPVKITLPRLDAPQIAAAPARQAPAFRVPGAKGGTIDLEAFSGKPVLFMFFTEGCPYCRLAGPALEALSKTYGPKGLSVLGVNLDDDKEGALNFARDLGVTFPLGYAGRAAFRNYKARGVPYIYLIDGDRNLVDVWEGYDESYEPMMKSAIETLLAAN